MRIKTLVTEVLWFDEKGMGPALPKVEVGRFEYPTPGPMDHVGMSVQGLGGASISSHTARQIAAALVEAADQCDAANAGKLGRHA